MKLIRNNVCYVQENDISLLRTLPEEVIIERRTNSIPENIITERKIEYFSCFLLKFEKYQDPTSVAFFQGREEILDYDRISRLSYTELQQEIDKAYDDREELIKIKDINEETKYRIACLSYRIEELKTYEKYRDIYDTQIENLNFNNEKESPSL